jgi:hypothetical protein
LQVWSVVAVLVLLASGCGGGKPQRTLSASQVVSALRQHGIGARIAWRASESVGSSKLNGFLGLSGARLAEHWGVVAFVQASFHPLDAPANAVGPPYVEAVVADTVRQAQRLAQRAPSHTNGRTLNVANVVLQVYRSAVPRIAAPVLDLMIQAAGPTGARDPLVLQAR